MLWLVYDCVKLFCNLKLNYNLMVCDTPNIIELCYFLAYEQHFSMVYMIWFICKMRVQHMYAFPSENLAIKGLNGICQTSVPPKFLLYGR